MGGSIGKTCAIHPAIILIGAKARKPVAKQKDFDKKIRQLADF